MGQASQEVASAFRVRIPAPLRSYTGGEAEVRLAVPVLAPEMPSTLHALLAALDAMYPGIRFRIVDEQNMLRPHIQVFVDGRVQRRLASPLGAGADVMIVAALSGG